MYGEPCASVCAPVRGCEGKAAPRQPPFVCPWGGEPVTSRGEDGAGEGASAPEGGPCREGLCAAPPSGASAIRILCGSSEGPSRRVRRSGVGDGLGEGLSAHSGGRDSKTGMLCGFFRDFVCRLRPRTLVCWKNLDSPEGFPQLVLKSELVYEE